jgi:hypothetical protein
MRASHSPQAFYILCTLLVLALPSCDSDPFGPEDPVIRQTVGPQGGIVQSEDGNLTLEFPAGAILQPTEIVCRRASEHEIPGNGVQTHAYDCQPEALQLQARVRVRIRFDPETVCDGCEKEKLRIRQRDRLQQQQQWNDCGQHQLNLQQGWAEGWTQRLGLLVLVIAEA